MIACELVTTKNKGRNEKGGYLVILDYTRLKFDFMRLFVVVFIFDF